MTFDPYLRYCEIMQKVYGKSFTLSREKWNATAKRPFVRRANFDIEEEQRDGWAYQQERAAP